MGTSKRTSRAPRPQPSGPGRRTTKRRAPRSGRPKTELMWEGKYHSDGRRRPVDQTAATLRWVDRFDAAPATGGNAGGPCTGEPQGPADRFVEGDRGTIIIGENRAVMCALLPPLRERVDLIYADPPFDVGSDQQVEVPIGAPVAGRSRGVRTTAYRDAWGDGASSYAHMMYERLWLMHQLLSERGSLYLHCDYRTSALHRHILDEIFGRENFINEIIWHYKTGGTPEKIGFGKKHDTIFFYAKSRQHARWNPQKEKSYLKHKYGFSNIDIQRDDGGLYTWVNCRDVFDIPALRGNQPERVDYPTQKPEALLDRIIRASSDPGDLVADFFCGSGTTGVVAQRLGRRWILADAGGYAVHTTCKRVLGEMSRHGRDHSAGGFDVFDAGEPGRGAGRLEAQPVFGRTNGVRTVAIELTGFTPAPSDTVEGVVAPAGLELVDYWAVDFDRKPAGPFRHAWRSFRTRGERSIDTVSAAVPVPAAGAPGRVCVMTVDAFGRRAETDIKIRV